MADRNGENPTFAGFPYSPPSTATARVGILGCEHGTLYPGRSRSHTAGAPLALRRALKGSAIQRDRYDFDLDDVPPGDAVDCGDVDGHPADAAGNRERIRSAVAALLARDMVPVILGGDDSIPIPVVAAFADRGPITVVQVDAHIDWRDEVDGERFGYSSPMRRISEMPWVERMIQVGMRGVGSARAEEVNAARSWGSHLVRSAEVHRLGVQPVLDLVPAGARCFVTVDCDGLDPSIMPAVIAPAPGGLTYLQVIELLHGIAAKARIAGFDLVEFMPGQDPFGHAALTAARLTCNAIAAILRPV